MNVKCKALTPKIHFVTGLILASKSENELDKYLLSRGARLDSDGVWRYEP